MSTATLQHLFPCLFLALVALLVLSALDGCAPSPVPECPAPPPETECACPAPVVCSSASFERPIPLTPPIPGTATPTPTTAPYHEPSHCLHYTYDAPTYIKVGFARIPVGGGERCVEWSR